MQPGGEDATEDYGDDEYFDGYDADIGDILTLPRRREEHDADDVSITSDDIGSDVISLNDDESYDVMAGDRKPSQLSESLKDDIEKFRKMRKEEKDKVNRRCLLQNRRCGNCRRMSAFL